MIRMGSDEPEDAHSDAKVKDGSACTKETGASFASILSEMNEFRTGSPKRAELLEDIAGMTGNNVIAYIANTDCPGLASAIDRRDPIPFFDLFKHIDKTRGIDLIINSNGGDPDVAEKIVKLCRSVSQTFRVMVPYVAKSAATLIALGADQVLMGRVSELGPIDPQISVISRTGKLKTFPANSYLDSVAKIEKAIQENGGRIPPLYLPYLNSEFEPSFVDCCEKAIQRAKRTAEEWLARYMLKGDQQKAESIANKLCDADREYLSHGKVIDAAEAQDLGLNVVILEQEDPLWKKLWEYYCRVIIMFNENPRVTKVYETPVESIRVGLKDREQ